MAWFEPKRKYVKTINGVRLEQDTWGNLARFSAVTGLSASEQVEKLLPKALAEAVMDEEFLAAEKAKAEPADKPKHAGGRPPKANAVGL